MTNPILINIKIPGSWNKKIFTATWVAENVFCLEQGSNLEAIILPSMDIGYKNEGIILLPFEQLLDIQIEDVKNTESYSSALEILNKLLELLPHTPIKGVGINIAYEINGQLSFMKNVSKNVHSIPGNYLAKQLIIGKDFKEYKLNILIDELNGKTKIQFNYHYDFYKPSSVELVHDFLSESQEIIELWVQ